MYCMKCGREISEENVFCDSCLEDMSRYPIKPGTPIQLPASAPVTEEKKKPLRPKKEVPPEQRLRQSRATVRLLALVLAVLVAAFVVLCLFTLQLLEQQGQPFQIF